MSKITVTLSSANMGDVDETDFDLWAAYVNQKIDDRTGLLVHVEQARFGDAGEDRIEGATDEQRDTIRGLLSVDLWNDFCGETWTEMRRAHDRENAA